MKLLKLDETIDLVWGLDPDVQVPDSMRTEDAVDKDGKPSREGRMIPAAHPDVTLREGAVVWCVRGLTPEQYSGLTPESKNPQVVRMGLVRARQVGGATLEGDAAFEAVLGAPLALLGDLAHAVWGVTLSPRFREQLCSGHRLG